MPPPRQAKARKTKRQSPPSNRTGTSESSLLARCPIDLLVEIARDHLTQQDRCQLSRVCRDLHEIFKRRLYIDDAEDDYKALWYACETDGVMLFATTCKLLRLRVGELRLLVNRPFQRDHVAPKRRRLAFRASKDLTPLVVAIRAGSFQIVQKLLEKGADAMQPDLHPIPGRSHCRLPANWAATLPYGQKPYVIRKIMGSLRQCGADLHARPVHPNGEEVGSREGAPLVQAISLRYTSTKSDSLTTAQVYDNDLKRVFKSRLGLLTLLVDNPPEAEESRSELIRLVSKLLQDFSRWRAAFYFSIELATENEKAEQKALVHKHVLNLLQVLLQQPDIARDIRRNPQPLWYACMGDPVYQEDVVSLLLEKGSFVGDIPLWAMCLNHGSSTKLFEKLLNHATTTIESVNVQDSEGATMLHKLCSPPIDKWRLDMAKLLIARGADLRIKDAEGMTPFHKAKQMHGTALIKLLRNAYNAETSTREPEKKKTKIQQKEALAPEDKNKQLQSGERKQNKTPKRKNRPSPQRRLKPATEETTNEESCQWLVETW